MEPDRLKIIKTVTISGIRKYRYGGGHFTLGELRRALTILVKHVPLDAEIEPGRDLATQFLDNVTARWTVDV